MVDGVLCLVQAFANLGDAFLTEAEARYLADHLGDPARVVVLAPEGVEDETVRHFGRLGISVSWLRQNKLSFFSACRQNSLMIGGGNAVRDTEWWWLLMTTIGCLIARLYSRDVALVGAGATTPVRDRGKRLTWWLILRCCRRVNMRDERSAALVGTFGAAVRKRVRVTNDVAFLAQSVTPSRGGARRVCAISPAIDQTEGVTIDPDRIVRFVGALRHAHVIDEARVVVHDIRPELDGCYCELLAERIATRLGIDTHVAQKDGQSPLVTAYGDAAVIVTARLHGLIIAALLNKPVVCLGETAPKLAPFARRFGYPCLETHPADEEKEFARVMACLRQLDLEALALAVGGARLEAQQNFV